MLDDSWIEKLYAARPKKDSILLKESNKDEPAATREGETLENGIQRKTDRLVEF